MGVFYPSNMDVFYISYDEPNAEVNWQRVQALVPRAVRMHGIKGFEAAHKACAQASTTERFLTIDGDNWLLESGLDATLDDTGMPDVVFSFKSRNAINALEYGNGGLKCWRSAVLLNSSTHESNGTTDFCWSLRYYQWDTLGSITVNNASSYQAWRAGYREGVKMSYIQGRPMQDPRRDLGSIWYTNRSKLLTWMSVGSDALNGNWAMLGARQGFCDLYLQNIDHSLINDYDWFSARWQSVGRGDVQEQLTQWQALMLQEFNMHVPTLCAEDSQWFKGVYLNPLRHGLMQ
jgi:hypothetical protein